MKRNRARKKTLRLLLPVALFAFVNSRPAVRDPGVIQLLDLAGEKTETLAAQYEHGPVLLNFWATYCKPCRREMPLLESVAARHPRVRLVFISVDPARKVAQVQDFVRELGIGSTVLRDPRQATVAVYLPDRRIPATFLLDREGRVLFRDTGNHPGFATDLEQALRDAGL